MRVGRCPDLDRGPLTGTWYRAVNARFFSTLLGTAHTARVRSRFQSASARRPGFPLLYLAEDHATALFEVSALLGSPLPGGAVVPNPAAAWVVVPLRLSLSRVIDLTDYAAVQLLETSFQELSGDWQGYALRRPHLRVPTQRLGRALHEQTDVEAFVTFSAKSPLRRNLVVFPDRLGAGSFYEYPDENQQTRRVEGEG